MCQGEKPEEVKNEVADPPLVTNPIVPSEVGVGTHVMHAEPPPPIFAHT